MLAADSASSALSALKSTAPPIAMLDPKERLVGTMVGSSIAQHRQVMIAARQDIDRSGEHTPQRRQLVPNKLQRDISASDGAFFWWDWTARGEGRRGSRRRLDLPATLTANSSCLVPTRFRISESFRSFRALRTTDIASKGWLEMAIQIADIATMVEGRLIGDGDFVCHGANPPGEASDKELTMLDDASRIETVVKSSAAAFITGTEVDLEGRIQIVVDDPHEAFAKIVAHFRPAIGQAMPESGVDSTAQIDPSADIHPTAIIGAGVKIGRRTRVMPGVVIMPGCEIGDDCVLQANVTLYEYTSIADRVVIHAATVVGANGFGYRQENGRHIPTSQLGYVAIESDVEIGAAVTIDRGTYGATRIGEGTKIDNQVMIAHNCQIGRHNLLCSQVGIAGSCRTGDYVILAGQVGLKDHISLGDHAIVGAQAGVMDDLEGNQVYLGSPATSQKDQMQIMAVERRLPEMRREMKKLRKELDQMKKQLDKATTDSDSSSDQRHAA